MNASAIVTAVFTIAAGVLVAYLLVVYGLYRLFRWAVK